VFVVDKIPPFDEIALNSFYYWTASGAWPKKRSESHERDHTVRIKR
jgi:hypothetical protein